MNRIFFAMGVLALVTSTWQPATAIGQEQLGDTAAPPPPNILLVLTDDVGFGATSTFGGPIPTPALDKLAKRGLRYNTFHTTGMCSPTRAALLTGRNHHKVNMGVVIEAAIDKPGYSASIPKQAATIAQILRDGGYATAAFGKWHLAPYSSIGPMGPFDRWPSGLGFNHFYGFLGSETDQFSPNLYEGTSAIDRKDDPDYILDKDLADHTILWLRKRMLSRPEKPFFIYYAPGTAHAPIQAPKKWIEKFHGRFNAGWDVMRTETFQRQKGLGIIPPTAHLTPRPEHIPAWDTLSAEQKKFASRLMESYAGMLSHADFQISRILDALREQSQLENTLVIYIQGDNGGAPQGGLAGMVNDVHAFNGIPEAFHLAYEHVGQIGGPETRPAIPLGFAHALNTPFQWYKKVASHLGGTRNGMVITWPAKINHPGLRQQFHHVVDIAPTILEAAGIEIPSLINGIEQMPMDGTSMVYSFNDASIPTRKKRQYFEMFGNKALYENGWMASSRHVEANRLSQEHWELYDLKNDYSQSKDVAATNPQLLRSMQAGFWQEAKNNNVQDKPASIETKQAEKSSRKIDIDGNNELIFYPGMINLSGVPALQNLVNRSFEMTANIEVKEGHTDGILAVFGDAFGGIALYILEGRPTFTYNQLGAERYRVVSGEIIKPGSHKISLKFKSDDDVGGWASIGIDDIQSREVRIEKTTPSSFAPDATFSIGEGQNSPVDNRYAPPFRFAGIIEKLTIKFL